MLINHLNKTNNENPNISLGLLDRPIDQSNIPFSSFLSDAIHQVNALDKTATDYSIKAATGELENIHEAMIAAQKAEISLQFMLEIRNKVLDAYREIMRMQI